LHRPKSQRQSIAAAALAVSSARIRSGNALILQVEAFRAKYGRLPEDLNELGDKDQDPYVFFQKTSDSDYIVWFGTSLGESEVYNSATHKWD
jgi:hypothetical protein